MKKIKICLAWHSLTSSNYGVNALTIAHIQLLYKAAEQADVILEIFTIGTPQNESFLKRGQSSEIALNKFEHYTVSAKIILLDLLSKGDLYKRFKDTDFIFDIGEGDSFSDIYGVKRLLNLISTKLYASFLGVKQIIAPQTIGPFNNLITKKISLFILRRAFRIYTRDAPSNVLLKKAGIISTQIADVAFSLNFDRKINKISNSVGINISGLLWSGGYTGSNQFDLTLNYKDFINSIINFFLKHNQTVYLISHVIDDINEREDDYRACLAVKNEYRNIQSVIVADKFNGAIDAKNFISRMRFFIGSRMHATIGAVSSGVPTIPVAYSRKFAGVFNEISYPHVIDAKTCSSEEALLIIKNKFLSEYSALEENAKLSSNIALSSNDKYLSDLIEILKNEKN